MTSNGYWIASDIAIERELAVPRTLAPNPTPTDDRLITKTTAMRRLGVTRRQFEKHYIYTGRVQIISIRQRPFVRESDINRILQQEDRASHAI